MQLCTLHIDTVHIRADPYHQDLYHKYCAFLPGLNNASRPGAYCHFWIIYLSVLA